MATAGTLLSELDSKVPVSNNKDDDLVNKILADMNIPMSGGNKIIQSPNPNSTYPVAMDPCIWKIRWIFILVYSKSISTINGIIIEKFPYRL